MSTHRTRRRLLADMLFVGGALLGASVLTRPEPFFEQLLEGQERPAPAPAPPPQTAYTKKYPSDHDVDSAVTEAYPSDKDHDLHLTCRNPSDWDADGPGMAPRPQPAPTSQARPFWTWLA